jgi:2-oxoglutarate ferredoxin oxidoreductase subunit beta
MPEITKLIHKYLRHDKKFPHVWCPGCGIGIMLGALIRGIDQTGYEKDEIVLVSGIGCSGRLPVYVDFNTLHTTHGRDHAVPVEKALKMKPEELKDKILIGVLVDKELPVYQDEYEKIRERAKEATRRL